MQLCTHVTEKDTHKDERIMKDKIPRLTLSLVNQPSLLLSKKGIVYVYYDYYSNLFIRNCYYCQINLCVLWPVHRFSMACFNRFKSSNITFSMIITYKMYLHGQHLNSNLMAYLINRSSYNIKFWYSIQWLILFNSCSCELIF